MTQDEFAALRIGDRIYHQEAGVGDGNPLVIVAADPINLRFTCVQIVTATNPDEWTKYEVLATVPQAALAGWFWR